MYFLTNKENIIVAISDELLSEFNLRDICLVSNALKNKVVAFDEENKELKVLNDKVFSYSSLTMHSILGELTLYTLEEKKEETLQEDNNIASTKETKENSLSELQKELNLETKETPTSIKEEKEQEEKQERVTLLDTQELKLSDDSINKLELQELKIPTIPEEALRIENEKIEKEKNENEKNISTLETLKEPLVENEEIKVPLSIEDTIKENVEKKENTQLKESQEEIKIPPITDNIKEEIASTNLEEKTTPKETYIKIDEVDYKLEEPSIIDEEKEEKTKKESKAKLFSKKLFGFKSDKKKEEETVAFDYEEKDIPSITEEISTPKKEEFINENRIENKAVETTLEAEKNIEEKESILVNETPIKEEEHKFLKLEEALIKDEEEEKKAQTIAPKIEEKKVEEKIATIEKEVDFFKNAQKINLDLDSYKMLLGSYLDEMESYKEKLEHGNSDIKNMLIDAGKLLSLDGIVEKLKELNSDVHHNQLIMKDISSYTKKLKEKLEATQENKTTVETTQEEIKTPKEEASPKESIEKEPIKSVAEDAIELSSANKLLEKIEAQEITVDLEETAETLNLPKDLIFEFIKDFLEQTKEHLNIFIEAHHNKDLEKIQTTAHMLKGASNNLRLNKIGDTLFKLQQESNFDNIALLIKKFAGQIKGLEHALQEIGE